MIKTYYYAIDKDGQGWYYDSPPIFDGESWNVDPTYDCLECMGAVNDLHPANLFSFPIPEDMTYLKTVLFQLLRLIKAHYNLRLMNS